MTTTDIQRYRRCYKEEMARLIDIQRHTLNGDTAPLEVAADAYARACVAADRDL